MHNPVSVLENETHKLIWYFDKQTHHLISARRPDLIKIKKKKKKTTCKIVNLTVSPDHIVKLKKIKMKRRANTLALLGNGKKTAEYESNGYTNCD